MPDETPPPPPPPPPEEVDPIDALPTPAEAEAAAATEPEPKRCIKPMSSILLGFLGCIIGAIAVYGVVYKTGDAQKVQITGNLGQMQEVLVDDTKTRGVKMFIASIGQWIGAIGAILGMFGLIAAVTHHLQANAKQVIPQRWIASLGLLISLVACCSVVAAVKHGYDANVGLHVENTEEAFNRLEQVANIQKKAQAIAEGNAPIETGGLDEQAMGLAENILGGTLNPLTQLGTEDYLGKRAENVEIYTPNGNIVSLERARNTRVLLMVMAGNSPSCAQAVPVLNQLRSEFALGQLLIMGVSMDKPVVIEAFVKRTTPRFPVGTPTENFLPEPFSSAHLKPTYFVIDRTGRIEKVLVGSQSIVVLRAAVKGQP